MKLVCLLKSGNNIYSVYRFYIKFVCMSLVIFYKILKINDYCVII